MTFYPFLTTFPALGSESHIFSISPFGGWQVWVIVLNFSENDKMDTYTFLVFLIEDDSVRFN